MLRSFGYAPLLLTMLLVSDRSARAADELAPDFGDGSVLEVALPAGWMRADTTLTVVDLSADPTAQPRDVTALFKIEWKSEMPPAVAVVSRVKRAGIYGLRAAKKSVPGMAALQLKFEQSATGGGPYQFRPVSAAQAPVAPAVLGLSGESTPPTAATQVGEKSGSIAELVMTEAANWDSSGEAGRRRYVKRFDTYPITSCRDLARIFRETAKDLADKKPIGDADLAMRTRIEEFYNRGASKYRERNPLKEDWQPFLQHLEKRLQEKYSATTLNDPVFAQFVLGELADGFDQLAQVWLDAAFNAGVHDVGDQPALNSAGTTYAAGSDAGNDSCPRCRKRCRCARLLFRH